MLVIIMDYDDDDDDDDDDDHDDADEDEDNYLSMPEITCSSVITRSIFSKILTNDTPIAHPLGRGMGVFWG